MGTEASFQAIPEACDLLQLARKDREIAENLQFINAYGTEEQIWHPDDSPKDIFVYKAVRELIALYPDVINRYFYAGARTYDAIIYLLSPQRRTEGRDRKSLISQAIYGSEPLCEGARATQGMPIGFVPGHVVKALVSYLDSITHEQLHEYYDPPNMKYVYKMHPTNGEETFQIIWEEFVGMRDVYRAVAEHNEAVITVID